MRQFIKNIFINLVLFSLLVAAIFNAPLSAANIRYVGPRPNDPDVVAFMEELTEKVELLLNKQYRLAEGFANANAYSSMVGNFDGYHGYDIAGVLVGFMGGAQLPKSKLKYFDEVKEEVEDELDSYAGFALGGAVNVGINAGHFGLKLLGRDIYFNIKFFYLKQELFSIDTEFLTFGVGVNWQLVKPKVIKKRKLIYWRGVSMGTGIFYNRNVAGFKADSVLVDVEEYDLTVEADVDLGLESNIVTIPIEFHTAIQLLWAFNFNFGIGFDINMGSTDILIDNKNALLENDVETGEYVLIDASTKNVLPRTFDFKVMLGAGLTVGPGVLGNISLTYYILHGFSLSLSAGICW